jgi:CubicO group peptidase (beta-lactamase class C family)
MRTPIQRAVGVPVVGLAVLLAAGSVAGQIGVPVPLPDTVVADTVAADTGMAGPSVARSGTAPWAEVWGAPPPAVLELEAELLAGVTADGVGSVAAAVVVGDSVIWQAAFGTADRERGVLAAPTTLYRAGSLAKPVTALVLLALVERGVVGLDDPVEPNVPELARLANRSPEDPAITYRHLASHTAGLAREPGTSRAGRGSDRDWQRSLLAAIPLTATLSPPGGDYHYSNVGYGILALALERAAGRPFQALARELVFEPLGMTSSYLEWPRAAWPRLAAGYVNPAPDRIDPRVPRAEHRGRGYRLASDGLYSTVGDLARLAMALNGALGDVPVTEASRSIALEGAPVGQAGYGLGVQLHRIGDTVLAGHSGAIAGYTAYLAVETTSQIGVVLLRNYNHGATNLGATAVRLILQLRDSTPDLRSGAAEPGATGEPGTWPEER